MIFKLKLQTFLFVLTLTVFNNAMGQSYILDTPIEFASNSVTTFEILNQFAEKGISFTCEIDEDSDDLKIELGKKQLKLKEVLDLMTAKSNLKYKVRNGNIIIKSNIRYFRVTGFVYDKNSGEQLIAANVYHPKTIKGTSTNNYGFYGLNLKKGGHQLIISYIGYKPCQFNLNLDKDTSINIFLEPDNILDEVTISEESIKINKLKGEHFIASNEIELKPLNLGESDLLKVFQLLPGIQPSVEGSTGLQIRGGSHYQNLIQIDGATIYNTDHAFGLFSVFNSDAIKNVQLIKGAFPARYGGRISSIINVRMNEGNNERFQFKYSTNILSSRVKVEGPFIKKKTSFMLSARKTHINEMVNLFENYSPSKKQKLGYYDLYAKIKHSFSGKSNLYISLFNAGDSYYSKENSLNEVLNSSFDSRMKWSNSAVALRWNYLFSEKLFVNSKLTYGAYKFKHLNYELKEYYNSQSEVEQVIKDEDFQSAINDIGFNIDIDFPVNQKHYIRLGFHSNKRIYKPYSEGRLTLFSNETENIFQIPTFSIAYDSISQQTNIIANSYSAYIEDEYDLTEKIQIDYGLRYNVYQFKKHFNHSIEPRLLLLYQPAGIVSLGLSYSRMSQNTHLLSNSFLIMPFNVWVPTTKVVKPLLSDQYTAIARFNVFSLFDLSLEGYYKTIENDILYKRWSQGNTNPSWEDFVEHGNKRSYGLEIMLEKKAGKLFGWATYTLSKTERKFESVNDGKYFPYWLVRKHKISATLNWNITKQLSIGANWVYSSSVPKKTNYQELAPVVYQDGINNANPFSDSWNLIKNIPAYHKLDLGATFIMESKRLKHRISIGANNIYLRNNPLLISEYDGYLYLSRINLFMPYLQYSISLRNKVL